MKKHPKILRIVEAAPSEDYEPNVAIDDFLGFFKDNGLPVCRASSVTGLRDALQSHGGAEAKYDIVQVLGHGAAGLLSLGWTWTRSYSDPSGGLRYLLDSDPNGYDVLSGYYDDVSESVKDLVDRDGEVYLVGCHVADGEPSTTVANGDTLMSDLAQMWGCKVSAPMQIVTTKTLDPASGLYAGEAIVWHWSTRPTRTVRHGSISPTALGTEPTDVRLVFHRLLSVPVFGPFDKDFSMQIDADIGHVLSEAFPLRLMSVPPFDHVPPLLALPELIFEVTWPGISTPHVAHLICNQRYVQVLNKHGRPVFTLAAPAGQFAAARGVQVLLARLRSKRGKPVVTGQTDRVLR